MLLSLAGRRTTRRRARALFGISRRGGLYTGTDLDEIAGVLRSSGRLSHVRWRFYQRFAFGAVASCLRRQLGTTRLPTLIWFGAVCRAGSVRAFHVSLVTEVRRDRIFLLDPLGRRPAPRRFNAWIADSSNRSKHLHVEGVFYEIDTKKGVGILEWRRP
jgi:hypothetical protein